MPADQPVLLLDLDRMLFASDRFMRDVAGVLDSRFGIDAARFKDEYAQYCVYNGEMRHYDLFRQAQAYGLEPAAVKRAICDELAGRDYAYDDVADFVSFAHGQSDMVMVLTHGTYDYQYLKYSFAPALRDLEFKDVLTHKRDYIAERFGGRSGFLIDDRQVGALPEGFRHIWVSREAAPGAYHSLRAVIQDWPNLWPPQGSGRVA